MVKYNPYQFDCLHLFSFLVIPVVYGFSLVIGFTLRKMIELQKNHYHVFISYVNGEAEAIQKISVKYSNYYDFTYIHIEHLTVSLCPIKDKENNLYI